MKIILHRVIQYDNDNLFWYNIIIISVSSSLPRRVIGEWSWVLVPAPAESCRCTRQACLAYTVRWTSARADDDDDAADDTSIPPTAEPGHRRRPGLLDARAPPHPLYIIIIIIITIIIIIIIIIILLRPEPCRVRRRRPARAVHMVNRGLHPSVSIHDIILPRCHLYRSVPSLPAQCSLITPLRATSPQSHPYRNNPTARSTPV